jgi:hypothetical protein
VTREDRSDAYQEHVRYDGPIEIKEDLAKEDECITDIGVFTGRHRSTKQKWRTDEETDGTYHRIYGRVPRS